MKILVVLGNRLMDDGSMSAVQKARLDKALEVIRGGGISKVILSGGMPNKLAGKTEASVMHAYLLQNGVDDGMIIEEDKSNTTVQNAKFCAPIIQDLRPQTVILCTSEYHVKRFFMSAKRLFERRIKKMPNVKLELATCKV